MLRLSGGRLFFQSCRVVLRPATPRRKRCRTPGKRSIFGLNLRRSRFRPERRCWKSLSREPPLPGLQCARVVRVLRARGRDGRAKGKPPEVASSKRSPGHRPTSREQTHSVRHAEEHRRGKRTRTRRFPLGLTTTAARDFPKAVGALSCSPPRSRRRRRGGRSSSRSSSGSRGRSRLLRSRSVFSRSRRWRG